MIRPAFLGRLAWRYALRHKGQTARALLGLFISTTVLVAGLGIADTITGAVEEGITARFGAIDVVVGAALPFNATMRDELAMLPLATAHHARGVPTLGLPGSATLGGLAVGNVLVRGVDPDEASILGPLPVGDGKGSVGEPQKGEVVLTTGVASALHASVGDVVTLRVPTLLGITGVRIVKLDARVSAVTAQLGRGGYVGIAGALVPLADLQDATSLRGQATQVLFVVDGGARETATQMQEHLRGGLLDTTYQARADKQAVLDEARSSQNQIAGFILAMSSFTLISAILLSFALLSTLVEERRAELGIARAMGLTRSEVALTMTFEGAYYALAAAAVGLVAGVAALYGLVALLSGRVPAEFQPYIHTALTLRALATAAIVGVLVPLVTIAAGSLRFARLDPSRAIRGIADDPKGQRRFGVIVSLLVVGIGAVVSFLGDGFLVGVPTALVGAGMALAALGWRKPAVLPVLAACGTIAWTLYRFTFPSEEGAADPLFTLGRGLLLALILVGLAVASPAPYDALARWRARKLRAPVLVTARYLLARRNAAGLTMAMIAIVVMVVVTMGTLFTTFAFRGADDVGGYQVQGTSVLPIASLTPIPPDVLALAQDIQLLPRVRGGGINLTLENSTAGPPFGIPGGTWGTSEGFAENNTVPIASRASSYATDREAWRAVARGEAALLADFLQPDPGRFWNVSTGDRVVVHGPGGIDHAYVVAGFAHTRQLGLMISAPHADQMGLRVGRVVLARAAPGVDPDLLAARLTATQQDQGLTFQSFREVNEAQAQQIQPVILVVESFLGVGLLVGLSSTGLLAARAVHERRREIGTMRALGFEERDVRRAFLLETTLTTGVGLLVGVVAGLLVSNSVWYRESRGGSPYAPPWSALALFAAALLVLAIVATLGPARRASRLDPAVAVRHVE